MKVNFPGWQLRCTKCQSTRPADEAGIVRIWAGSVGKTTVSMCRHCRKLRWQVIERKYDPSSWQVPHLH